MNDKLYKLLLNIYRVMKRLKIYEVPKLKGIIYNLLALILTITMKVKYLNKYYKRYSLNKEKREKEIIISLTTFPKRINNVYLTICTLFEQKYKADKIILWLAEDEFSDGYSSIPKELIDLTKCGLEIRFCDNLKPHKKYYYSMKENKDSIIITVDDDVFYPSNVIDELVKLHYKYPNSIVCTRAHLMKIENDSFTKYSEWFTDIDIDERPNNLLCPTGIGGVLYPPKCFDDEVFNKEAIIKTCLSADDLWLKIMGLINNVSVIKSNKFTYAFLSISKSQKSALSNENVKQNQNDIQLNNILELYSDRINIRLL